jgi:hypothetical protein
MERPPKYSKPRISKKLFSTVKKLVKAGAKYEELGVVIFLHIFKDPSLKSKKEKFMKGTPQKIYGMLKHQFPPDITDSEIRRKLFVFINHNRMIISRDLLEP